MQWVRMTGTSVASNVLKFSDHLSGGVLSFLLDILPTILIVYIGGLKDLEMTDLQETLREEVIGFLRTAFIRSVEWYDTDVTRPDRMGLRITLDIDPKDFNNPVDYSSDTEDNSQE